MKFAFCFQTVSEKREGGGRWRRRKKLGGVGKNSRVNTERISVLVSFEGHGRSQVQSFPRKRESTSQAIGNAPPRDWIPASAGMTAVSKGIRFQMTPLPNPTSSCRSRRPVRSKVLFSASSGLIGWHRASSKHYLDGINCFWRNSIFIVD